MDRDDLVRELLGVGLTGAPDPAAPYRLGSVADAEIKPVEWLWEGYILKGQLTLLDARGGSGKTSLLGLIAAAGSLGAFTFGREPEPVKTKPFRTLLFNTEDDRGDLRHVYEQCGGMPTFLEVYDPYRYGPLNLDHDGMDRLTKIIEVNAFDLVCFDPVLQYVPKEIKSQNDNVAVTQFLAAQRSIAMRTGAAIVNVRHFAKGSQGRDMTEAGAGGEAWRNSSRGQLTMLPHPDCTKTWFQSLVFPARSTIRTTRADAFAIEIRDGYRTWVRPADLDLDPYIERHPQLAATLNSGAPKIAPGRRGPAPHNRQLCADALVRLLAGKKHVYSRDAVKDLGDQGFNKTSIYDARNELIATGYLTDDRGRWSLTDKFDMFADDEDGPWWTA